MAAIATEAGYNKCCQETVCNTDINCDGRDVPAVSAYGLTDVSCVLPEPQSPVWEMGGHCKTQTLIAWFGWKIWLWQIFYNLFIHCTLTFYLTLLFLYTTLQHRHSYDITLSEQRQQPAYTQGSPLYSSRPPSNYLQHLYWTIHIFIWNTGTRSFLSLKKKKPTYFFSRLGYLFFTLSSTT